MPDFVAINTKIINALYKKIKSVPEITPNEIELVATILRGILKDPDVVDDAMFENRRRKLPNGKHEGKGTKYQAFGLKWDEL